MFGPLLLLFAVSPSLAADLLLVSRTGPPLPGRTAQLELAIWEEDGPDEGVLEGVTAKGGRVLKVEPTERPGLYVVRYRAPAEGGVEDQLEVVFQDGTTLNTPLPIAGLPGEALRGPGLVEGVAGSEEAFLLRLTGSVLPAAEDLAVVSSEGSVAGIRREDDALVVEWKPDPDRQPRVALVGIRESRVGGVPPTWVRVRLRARAPVSVATEPGTRLAVDIGERSYGPVEADETGTATAMVDVYPGETTAHAELVDALGNSQKTTISLGALPAPSLGAVVEGALGGAGAPPVIHLYAVRPDGRTWRGALPVCRPTGGGLLEVVAGEPGHWQTEVVAPPDAGFDLRVDCLLLGKTLPIRVPVSRGVPAQVRLRVYPTDLSADFPIAQVQASLEDHAGERLVAEGLVLEAMHGTLTIQPEGGTQLRADYEGDSSHPDDTIRAVWVPPAGSGGVAHVVLSPVRAASRLEVGVFATDGRGRPLGAVPVSLVAGGEEVRGDTGADGWFRVDLTARDHPVALQATAMGVQAATLHLPWDTDAAAGGPVLQAMTQVRIQAGRVRNVFISAEPSVLFTGQGRTATLQVRLLDRGGAMVVDEPVSLTADSGVIGPVTRQSDGSLTAEYIPPPDMVAGQVVVTAQGGEGGFSASTNLVLQPRPAERTIAASMGVLAGARGVVGPLVIVDLERRLPFLEERFLLRGSAVSWSEQATVVDAARESEVVLDMGVLSLGLAAVARREAGSRATWMGMGTTLTPYYLETRFGDLEPTAGWGLFTPGVSAFAGGARRTATGEVTAEARFVGAIGSGDILGFGGQVGGMALVLGYRAIL